MEAPGESHQRATTPLFPARDSIALAVVPSAPPAGGRRCPPSFVCELSWLQLTVAEDDVVATGQLSVRPGADDAIVLAVRRNFISKRMPPRVGLGHGGHVFRRKE